VVDRGNLHFDLVRVGEVNAVRSARATWFQPVPAEFVHDGIGFEILNCNAEMIQSRLLVFEVIGIHVAKRLMRATGPPDINGICFGAQTQPEMRAQIALREVTATARGTDKKSTTLFAGQGNFPAAAT
jgi:hypothetical protein